MENLNRSEVNAASAYFNENWQRYLSSVRNNTLYHRETMAAVQRFLSMQMKGKPFSFVDVGCGDSSNVAPIFADTPIKKYIGIDAAKDILLMASNSLAQLDCEKEFIADNMTTAIPNLSFPVDIIFTSYAVHHLSSQDKVGFIANCKKKLTPNGFLLMVDGILKHNQSRDAWLDNLQARMQETNPDVSSDEIAARMEHPRMDDFPESIETFAKIAKQQSWKDFQVILDKGIFAFMVFSN